MQFNLKNFVFPQKFPETSVTSEAIAVSAIIPSFKPDNLTYELVRDLVRWNQNVNVFVVDDSTPLSFKGSHKVFERIRSLPAVKLLRTPQNKLKAGALNFGLYEILNANPLPEVILTLDDDVVITPLTIKNLVKELLSQEHLGAVCSQCRALNKNKNLLTRLQGLEYVSFNAARLADEGFYYGPLVMHGMLTAFRTDALREVGGFKEKHLIEDYEITTRLKEKGWHVKAALSSIAWTTVPETFSQLWRQRVRWAYGGLTILDTFDYSLAVIQDIIGHSMFLVTFGAIIASFFLSRSDTIPSFIPYLIIGLSFLQLIFWYGFQVWLMRFYPEKDRYDWLLRISIVPEFVYANVLTLVLIGAYSFLIFNKFSLKVPHFLPLNRKIIKSLYRGYKRFGYVESWGTR